MADDKIIIEFDGDISQLKAKLKTADKDVSRLKKSGELIGKGISSAAKPAAVAIAGITAALGASVKAAANVEKISTQFKVLTGSTEAAAKTVRELQEFSANTPFQFEGISTAAQQLLGFGFEANNLVPKLQEIGDVASAVGQPLEEVSLIFGQVAAAGKLTGERLLQFQERAIPIGPAIAQTMGVAESAVKDLVSKGQVDFKTFEQAFASLSKEGGVAFGGMIQQSQTFSGLMSTVGDNVTLLASDIGQELLPAAKNLANAFIDMLKGLKSTDNFFTTTVKYWGEYFKGASSKSVPELKEEIVGIDDELKKVNATLDLQKRAWAAGRKAGLKSEDMMAGVERFAEAEDRRKELVKQRAEYTRLINERSALDAAEAARKGNELEQQINKEFAKANSEFAAEDAKNQYDAKLLAAQEGGALLTEQQMIDLQAQIEQRTLADELEKAQELERQGKHVEAVKALEDTRTKNQLKASKSRADMDKRFADQRIGLAQQTATLINTIAGEETKIGFMIAKAAAAAQVLVDKARADMAVTAAAATIAMAGPQAIPIAEAYRARGVALNAATAGVSLATIAAQVIQGFADGGLVSGGIAGRDSVPAMLMPGELVTPRSNFEEVIGSVRAQREAEARADESGVGGATIELSFKDNIGEFIEANILERRSLGIGAI